MVPMKAKIINYLENELSPSERKAFEQALTTDSDLQKAFEFQKAQWEKLSLLRLHSKAGDFLKEYEALEAPVKFYAFMTVRRTQFAAVAASILLAVLIIPPLINRKEAVQKEASISTKQEDNKGSVAAKASTEPAVATIPDEKTGVAPQPQPPTTSSAAPATDGRIAVAPKMQRPQDSKPTQPLKKSPSASSDLNAGNIRLNNPPDPIVVHAPPQKDSAHIANSTPQEPNKKGLKVGMPSNDSSASLPQRSDSAHLANKVEIDSIQLLNTYDFDGDVAKHLAKINCNHYTVSFKINKDGTVEDPKLEKGDKNCEKSLLEQIKSMPILRHPHYKGSIGEYRYHFTKD
jgi:hypothetical protein